MVAVTPTNRTSLERIPAFETQALIAYARHYMPEAIALCLEALNQFGLALPTQPTALTVRATVFILQQYRLAASICQLYNTQLFTTRGTYWCDTLESGCYSS